MRKRRIPAAEEVTHNTEIVNGGERKCVLRVDVIIPIYEPGGKFSRLLKIFSMQTYPIGKIIVTNAERACWNEKNFEGIGNLEVCHLSKEEFDHGTTRNRGAHYSKADIMILMTDDAVPADEKLIKSLTAAFEKRGSGGELVTVAYARQLPDKDCTMAERFTRSFNYLKNSYIRTKEDPGRMGIKTPPASNVCRAYGRKKFWFQGGFIHKTIFNGDMIFTDKAVLQDDYAIVHVTEAKVVHSHNYGRTAQFRRDFDLAVSQTNHPKVFEGIRPEGEGICLVRQTTHYLAAHCRLWLVPGLIAESGFKYAGYRLSGCYHLLPIKLAAMCSINKEHWKQQEKAGIHPMMTVIFRVISAIVSILTMAFMIRGIRQAKVQVEAALLWVIMALILVVFSLFPAVADACAYLLGIYSTPNFLFLFMIFLLIVKVFGMILQMSQMESKQKELVQRIALNQKDREELEPRIQRFLEKEETAGAGGKEGMSIEKVGGEETDGR